MQTVVLVAPPTDDKTAPEDAPVGSLAGYLDFVAKTHGEGDDERYDFRLGFGGRDVSREAVIMAMFGLGASAPRNDAMLDALADANLAPQDLIFEVVQSPTLTGGNVEGEKPKATPTEVFAGGVTGYWVASWPIQTSQEPSTPTLVFQRLI